MSVENKERIEQKLAQARRLLDHASDNITADMLAGYIEELETRLLALTTLDLRISPGTFPAARHLTQQLQSRGKPA
jgi:hypothetical protein